MTEKRDTSPTPKRRSHHAPAANPRPPRRGTDSGKPAPEDQTPAVADERDPRLAQPDGSGSTTPVEPSDEAGVSDETPKLKAPAHTARKRSDKAHRAPVHNPDPSPPADPAVLGDGTTLPADHDFGRDGPTFAPATDPRLAISPHGDNPNNESPQGVVGNATTEQRYADSAYLPLDPSRATDEVRIDGSYAIPNPPQFVATEGRGEFGPSVHFDAPSSAVAQSAVDAEYARIVESSADSPHGAVAEQVGHPHQSGAPADSHGPADIGDNPAADARARTLADLRAAEAMRYTP